MAAGVQGESVARNYAEALLVLARKADDAEGWGALLRQVADAINNDVNLSRFLESPRIAAEQKSVVLSKALGDKVPHLFLRFLQQLVKNRRQMLIPAIATEYETLRDAASGIVHARVTVARETGDEEAKMIAERLSKATGKTVVPHFAVDPSILGGVVVRVGDTVMDGSLRRKLGMLRRRMGGTRA
ncbi:MAG TPA: F0F1 ATP synthase subunit delta [Gemmatimonas aurantiaca]|uniref:ATP synthase subunit delta n=2 Tax=Gemmatimonas aurantiaca TaxID=173480 RepID=ATPD_GEMAT|nr:F0F1 ATP synthase subunit delta [Gemmatimonas aurantiaca]C1ABC3.1 RecName: Full=ATP synthase subunit delta; AltName: Full=ATP synthase F(1) sector subunit delta; AltName: Full=F-type ATPase subunit delta; Short=F-ATPase subunit delta [Gemmatimonas aurantiaca T-27]BAH39529.1 ATP synthase subunit delta [Gemmatimonas aurantiaca T-27]HCT58461.1 F0F1 ATP synthase subunit delta [Gemmatimonas aurantiaca]